MARSLETILKLEVPIIVLIGARQLPMDSVVALAPGSIIELPKTADEELELLVNNKPIGSGIAVKLGENFGIKISFIGDVRERLEALAGGAATPKTAESSSAAAAPDEALADSVLTNLA